ncbi:MAG: D-glycero-beta-D-manno-heptose 1,7-bisphosphate 7-phosphatase [Candidatus Jettenia sp.]|uniref:D,D-heptose 1,7-bisphosphate phosphatase n=1 Tax=Candidatus Jettenia caeni TaxID=247490 RepID=I3IRF0_9BACT|nr:D-glycero-beta-D-manno-heptose 1,7-bisphosphate 7-phosphatase [Candidatus Jettenia sp. AMX1]MBC6929129.1 D-glycero-beta-D-manno-heptose 1,7-bisphosphate 7-phosphatase [Candidatus Jettenia sp.]WKZ15707.1 MAG: D-glycero-beta-D-manno-heptose 1,7-bisphosphate 7-phosphatase [Candidatus Jettenia caeni]KAA0249583.1 MAG: D-glycero-beta-D-manno-heptose 1,7-bisphosphate 7-phosphatase [Candidatus Jettenia sp. AMX1]MCE7880384.1 D-glycero-beta-D-manno-heptose 1,7-bisphosphate 7-phosphatase [Candidatus Je
MKKRKAVFLDRDGTVIVHKPYLNSPDQLLLLPNAAQGIRLFNEEGYLVIVITNQSGIARGFFDEKCLELIHKKMTDVLRNEGAMIDDIYYCPHYKEGMIQQYTKDCDCRKPKIGMFLEAARQYHIDFSQSLMIGDSEVDIRAGKNAGCKCVLIKDSKESQNTTIAVADTDYVVKDLLEAARLFTE